MGSLGLYPRSLSKLPSPVQWQHSIIAEAACCKSFRVCVRRQAQLHRNSASVTNARLLLAVNVVIAVYRSGLILVLIYGIVYKA